MVRAHVLEVENLASIIDAGGMDVWQSMVTVGIEARTLGDVSRAILGQLALSVQRGYCRNGDPSNMQRFAAEVGVGVDSLYTYKRAVERVGFVKMMEYIAQNVTYSHIRAALSLKDPDLIRDTIEKQAGLKDLGDGESMPTLGGGGSGRAKLAELFDVPVRLTHTGEVVVPLGVDDRERLKGYDRVKVVFYGED